MYGVRVPPGALLSILAIHCVPPPNLFGGVFLRDDVAISILITVLGAEISPLPPISAIAQGPGFPARSVGGTWGASCRAPA